MMLLSEMSMLRGRRQKYAVPENVLPPSKDSVQVCECDVEVQITGE